MPATLSAPVEAPQNSHRVASRERPLRIALFTFSYAPFMTGIATGAQTRVKALLALGHEVFLIHPQADAQYAQDIHRRTMCGLDEFAGHPRFTSAIYPTKPHPFFRCHPEPRSHRHWSDTALLERFQPDVILVDEGPGMRGFTSIFMGGYGRAVGAEYSARTGIPAVQLFETDWFSYAERYFGRWLTAIARPVLVPLSRRYSENYVSTFFPSRMLFDKYQHYGVIPSEYVPFHGVDCSQFHPGCRQHNPIPQDDRPTLLFVGRTAREKSIGELFDVIQLVRKQVPETQLVIVGGGGPDAERIRSAAAKHVPYCTFWGESFGEQLKGWYARADVFVNPSATENFCTTNLEALACGTPLVLAAAGGNREQVVDGVNGYLVPPHDPAAMAARVVEILQSPTLRQSMSQNAREFALKFDVLECGRSLETALRQRLILHVAAVSGRAKQTAASNDHLPGEVVAQAQVRLAEVE